MKMANRHGAKGIVSNICKEEKMPKININGEEKSVDIVVNPLGIISRMNIGQLYELHMSMILYYLKLNIKEKIKNLESQDSIKQYLLEFIKIIDCTENNWYLKQFKENIENINIDEIFINDLTIVQPPFESTNYDKLMEAKDYVDADLLFKVYDPNSKSYIYNPITVGFMYFSRMHHIAEDKLTARGIGPYTKRTLQPLKGKKNKGGQRLGEMEVMCLAAYDAKKNLKECLSVKSDAIDTKNKWLKEQLDSIDLEEAEDKLEATRLLESYLTLLGVDMLNN